MTGIYVLVIAGIAALAMPRLLSAGDWAYRSPRLGIIAWYATLIAVTGAVAAALVIWTAPWQGPDVVVCRLWHWCADRAGGRDGLPGRLLLVGCAVTATALLLRVLLTAVRIARAASVRRSGHRRLLAVVGRPSPRWGATVIDDPRPAAYVLSGRRRDIVVTTGALATLPDDEIAAVIAHERAHADGRHDLIIDGARLLTTAFPRVPLFVTARLHLTRLVELRADEVATTVHRPLSLARALVAMASATAAPAGHSVLAAAGGDALQRLGRLLIPPPPLTRSHIWTITGGLVLLAASPVVLVAATAWWPDLGALPDLF